MKDFKIFPDFAKISSIKNLFFSLAEQFERNFIKFITEVIENLDNKKVIKSKNILIEN